MRNYLQSLLSDNKVIRVKGNTKMSLTQLESSLFESVEFCLALLGTIPVPICLVKQDGKIVSLNAVKIVDNDKLQQVRCAHSSNMWEFEAGSKCILCQTIEECKKTKQKTVKKGIWKIAVGDAHKDLIIVAHAVYTKIRNEEFIFVAIEDLTEVEKLKGLLPICMMCNKIYDHDTSKWVKIDEYITDRSPAKFSHGVCPDCSQVMMDDIK